MYWLRTFSSYTPWKAMTTWPATINMSPLNTSMALLEAEEGSVHSGVVVSPMVIPKRPV